MDEKTSKKWSVIVNVLYAALIIGAFYLIFKTFFGVLLPFLLAFFVAAILNRPVSFIEKKTPLKRGPLSAVFVLLILAVVGGLFTLAGAGIVSKLKDFYDYVIAQLQNTTQLLTEIKFKILGVIGYPDDSAQGVAAELYTRVEAFFDGLIENGLKDVSFSGIPWSGVLSKSTGVIKGTVGAIPSMLIASVVSIVACVFMTVDFENIKAFIVRQFPSGQRAKLSACKKITVNTFKSMVKAYSLIILITTCELSLGFFILRLIGVLASDFIVLIALIIAIIDIIPVLGTGTVLVPWAVYSFISGKIGLGIGLLIIYAAVTVIRQIIEPKLVAGQADLSPIVTIIAMYIGTKTLGILGFFILPFSVILIKKFNDEGIIHLFKSGKKTPAEQAETVAENE